MFESVDEMLVEQRPTETTHHPDKYKKMGLSGVQSGQPFCNVL